MLWRIGSSQIMAAPLRSRNLSAAIFSAYTPFVSSSSSIGNACECVQYRHSIHRSVLLIRCHRFLQSMSWSFWLNGISTISRPVVVICRQIGKTVSCICVSLMLWKDMSTWHEISYLHNTNMIQCVGTSVLTIPYQSTIYHHTHGDLVGFSGFYHERSFITWTFSY